MEFLSLAPQVVASLSISPISNSEQLPDITGFSLWVLDYLVRPLYDLQEVMDSCHSNSSATSVGNRPIVEQGSGMDWHSGCCIGSRNDFIRHDPSIESTTQTIRCLYRLFENNKNHQLYPL